MNHIHDRNHILVDRIGGSPRRVRVTETAERPVLPSLSQAIVRVDRNCEAERLPAYFPQALPIPARSDSPPPQSIISDKYILCHDFALKLRSIPLRKTEIAFLEVLSRSADHATLAASMANRKR